MQNRAAILVVTDSDVETKILERMLHQYRLTFIEDPDDAMQAAGAHLPDLLIIDGMMAGDRGMTLCKSFQSDHRTAKIPVLFMFESITADQITEMFRAGGADYVNKPFNQVELAARVHVHVVNSVQRRRLELLAMYDPMTMCYNRRMFFEESNKYLEHAQKHEEGITVMVFSIASFGRINEEFGHFTGDRVLKAFADVLKQTLPSSAIIGRLGGKEFGAVILGGTRETDTELAERVMAAAYDIRFHDEHLLELEFGLARRMTPDDTVDSMLLVAAHKIPNCHIVRTSRNY